MRIWGDSDNMGGGDLTLNSPINTNGGNLYLSTGSGAVTLNSDMLLGTGRIFFKADGSYTTGDKVLNGSLSASGDVNIDTAFTMGGNASIYTDGNINFGAVNVNLNTGRKRAGAPRQCHRLGLGDAAEPGVPRRCAWSLTTPLPAWCWRRQWLLLPPPR